MNNYKEIKTLGSGSYGRALLVRHISTKKLYVIKNIQINDMNESEINDCMNEVKVLEKLHHPNIIKYYGSFYEKQNFNIILEYANSGDLAEKIYRLQEKNEYFSVDQILYIFAQICCALSSMHKIHILHRDIKTQNIFLTDGTFVKLGDFGISKILDKTSDCAKTVIGTPYNLSPELCEDLPYDNKSDIWSLGCVLYEMTTTKRPFEGNNICAVVMKILNGKYLPIPQQYPKELSQLIDSMLQQNPKDRPSVDRILSLPFIRNALNNWSKLSETIKGTEIFQTAIKNKVKKTCKNHAFPQKDKPHNLSCKNKREVDETLHYMRDKHVKNSKELNNDREKKNLEKIQRKIKMEEEEKEHQELQRRQKELKKEIHEKREQHGKELKEHEKEYKLNLKVLIL